MSKVNNMQCPTCGKPVRKNQEVCSFCGSLVTDIRVQQTATTFPDIKTPEEPVFTNWDMHPRAPVFEGDEVKPEAAPQAPQLPPSAPSAEPSEPPPRRRIPLIRVLTLLIFLLIPLFNSIFRNFIFVRETSPAPVLSEAIFCEDYAAGAPVNPKSIFSLERDGQLVLYSHWKGSLQGHAVVTRWYTPQGALLALPAPVTHYAVEAGGSSAISILPLRAGMQTGIWRTDVLLDGQLRATLKAQVRR